MKRFLSLALTLAVILTTLGSLAIPSSAAGELMLYDNFEDLGLYIGPNSSKYETTPLTTDHVGRNYYAVSNMCGGYTARDEQGNISKIGTDPFISPDSKTDVYIQGLEGAEGSITYHTMAGGMDLQFGGSSVMLTLGIQDWKYKEYFKEVYKRDHTTPDGYADPAVTIDHVLGNMVSVFTGTTPDNITKPLGINSFDAGSSQGFGLAYLTTNAMPEGTQYFKVVIKGFNWFHRFFAVGTQDLDLPFDDYFMDDFSTWTFNEDNTVKTAKAAEWMNINRMHGPNPTGGGGYTTGHTTGTTFYNKLSGINSSSVSNSALTYYDPVGYGGQKASFGMSVSDEVVNNALAWSIEEYVGPDNSESTSGTLNRWGAWYPLFQMFENQVGIFGAGDNGEFTRIPLKYVRGGQPGQGGQLGFIVISDTIPAGVKYIKFEIANNASVSGFNFVKIARNMTSDERGATLINNGNGQKITAKPASPSIDRFLRWDGGDGAIWGVRVKSDFRFSDPGSVIVVTYDNNDVIQGVRVAKAIKSIYNYNYTYTYAFTHQVLVTVGGVPKGDGSKKEVAHNLEIPENGMAKAFYVSSLGTMEPITSTKTDVR